jgi:hypothetical protein
MKPSAQLLLAATAALLLASCAAMQPAPAPKAPSGVQSVRVHLVNQGNTHDTSANTTARAPSSDAISAAMQRAFQQSLSEAGLRVVSSCEDEDCAEIEARFTSESWVDEEPYNSTNARATVTLVSVRDGEILGQGSGAGGISQDAQVHPYGTSHIANTALGEAFKSPLLANASFNGKTPASTTGGGEAAASQQDTADGAFSHVGQPQRSSYALVIGVEDYRDLPATVGSRADAEAFVELLESSLGVPQENIRTLIDDRATKSDLEEAIRWVRNNVPQKGRIYLYFSGHGAPDPTTGKAYLLPYEAKSNNIAHGGMAIDDVLSELGKSQAGEVLAFVDSCFSGEGERSVLEEGIRPVVPIKEPDATSKTVLFSASGAKQISGTTAEGTGGLFTHHLLNAIGNGQADVDGDRSISLGELASYVEPRVAREAKKLSREQNPTLSMGEALASPDDFLLVWGLSAAK